MIKKIILVFLLLTAPALANPPAPCGAPQVTSGWGSTFSGTTDVTGFVYDYVSETMYVSLPIVQYINYLNVPYSIAMSFSNNRAPDQFYLQQIQHVYEEALEAENCLALSTENGAYIAIN